MLFHDFSTFFQQSSGVVFMLFSLHGISVTVVVVVVGSPCDSI